MDRNPFEYHDARMAALVEAPTVFRMLNDTGRINGPQQFSIAENGMAMAAIDHDFLTVALQTIKKSSPGGCTLPSQHVREIRPTWKKWNQLSNKTSPRLP